MFAALLLAGLVLLEVPIKEPVLAVRVADIDANGTEEIIAVTSKELFVIQPDGQFSTMPAPALTIVGHGLLVHTAPEGLVDREGKKIGPRPLLNHLDAGKPALLTSPGDLDGDGRDDPIYATQDGIVTPKGLVPVLPRASLEIKRSEAFAVQFTSPIPAVGNWSGKSSGKGRELVLFDDNSIRCFAGAQQTAQLALPLKEFARSAEGVRRNEIFVRDLDRDGRLDLVLVMGRGSMKVFAEFEVNVWEFRGGRVYDEKRKGFFRPATTIKVSGALLGARLFDADGDGDLDLALSTISTSILSAATAQYLVFRCEDGKLERKPTWRHQGVIPITALKREPDPPATLLPDLDGDKRPELVLRGPGVRVLRGTKAGGFAEAAKHRGDAQRPVAGRKLAVMITKKGLLIIR
ncbi:MAG: FG-GAP-like repeat-containing protein [Planctomycetota bacterium]|jgi:hypothetical protein